MRLEGELMDLVSLGKCRGFAQRILRRVVAPEPRAAFAQEEQVMRASPCVEGLAGQLPSVGVERRLVAIEARKLHEVQRSRPSQDLRLSGAGENEMRIA